MRHYRMQKTCQHDPPRCNSDSFSCLSPALHSVQRNTEFGYSRKDVIIIGAGLTAAGCALYYGLQAGGMDAAMAGNWAQVC
jgi:hypothetical protein